jgi:hypothetical protein
MIFALVAYLAVSRRDVQLAAHAESAPSTGADGLPAGASLEIDG